MKKLAIIIPTYNRDKQLGVILDSISRQSNLQKSYNLEVYVVSNVFSNDTQELVRRSGHNYLFTNEVGANLARNLGIKEAIKSSPDFLFFFDDDCIIHSQNIFDTAINFFENNINVDLIGGHYRTPPDSSSIDHFYNNKCMEWISFSRVGSNHWTLLGGCLVIRANVFNTGTYFDENIKYGCTETEFLHRLNVQGITMRYLNDFFVTHSPHIRLRKLMVKAYKQGFYTSFYRLDFYPKRFNVLGPPQKLNLSKNCRITFLYDWLYTKSFQLGLYRGNRS